MKNRTIISAMAVAALSCTPVITWGQQPKTTQQAQQQQEAQPIGRVTAEFGTARADTAAGSRPLDLQSLINNDERIVTDGGGLTVLLASRVVLKIDVHSAVSVFESPTQTTLSVEYGTVHVYVGQRPVTAGVVSVQDPNGRVETANGVFLANYDPQTQQSYIACEHEQVTISPKSETASTRITGDRQAMLHAGKMISTGDLDRTAFNDVKKSLDRLGQATVSRGAETFRLRSRAFDTESAISQLSAAGWIDPRTLPGANPVVASSSSGSSSGNATSLSEVNTGQPIQSSKSTSNDGTAPTVASTVAPTVPDKPAADNKTNLAYVPANTPAPSNAAPTGTLTLGTPPQPVNDPPSAPLATDPPVAVAPPPSAPPAITINPSAPVSPIDLGTNPPTADLKHGVADPISNPDPIVTMLPPGHIDHIATPTDPINVTLDGPGKGPKADKPHHVPKIDLEPTASIPKVDLDLGSPGPRGSAPDLPMAVPAPISAPVADLPAPPTDAITPSAPVTTPAPVVKIDPPKADLGDTLKDAKPAPAPVTIAPPPKVDLGLDAPPSAPVSVVPKLPKADFGNLKDTKIDKDASLGSLKDVLPTKDATLPKAPKDVTGDLTAAKDPTALPDLKPGDDKTAALPGPADLGLTTPTKDGALDTVKTDTALPKAGDITTDADKTAVAPPSVDLPTPDQVAPTDKTTDVIKAPTVTKTVKKDTTATSTK